MNDCGCHSNGGIFGGKHLIWIIIAIIVIVWLSGDANNNCGNYNGCCQAELLIIHVGYALGDKCRSAQPLLFCTYYIRIRYF